MNDHREGKLKFVTFKKEQMSDFMWIIDQLENSSFSYQPETKAKLFNLMNEVVLDLKHKVDFNFYNFGGENLLNDIARNFKNSDIKYLFLIATILYCIKHNVSDSKLVFYLSLQMLQATCSHRFEENLGSFIKSEMLSGNFTLPSMVNIRETFQFCIHFSKFVYFVK